MTSAGTNQRTCPNCGTPNPITNQRCIKCDSILVAATMMMDSNMIGIATPNLQIMPDRGSAYSAKLDGDVVNIGSKADRDITITADGVAEFHTRLRRDGKSYRIYSLGGSSAVLINGQAIAGSHLLTAGDKIRLQDAQGRGATLVFENPMEQVGSSGSIGDTHLLLNLPFTIGRDPKSDLVIDSLTVSWNHAQIVGKGNVRQLADAGSTNGSRINGQLITQPTALQAGDTIQISNFTYLYDGMQLRRISATPDIRLMAVQLEMTYQRLFPRRSSHTTVRDVSLAFEPQEFIAIVGGSGSGKSTLLRMLNGVSHATGGHIYANGDDLYANYPTYQSVIGYVPQADIVHGELTVWQGLWFAAQLRFPNEQQEPRQQRISRALDLLELTAYKDNLIRNLSGGQRKRVSIALELMAEPPLLFLDEPGSGLDPGLDTTMMRTLRRMADRGHTVVIVTHTTLNLDLCDKLIVMSQGRLTFYGTPKEALKFFNVESYAEIYNILMEPKTLVDMTQTYAADMGAIRGKPNALAAGEAADQWRDAFKGSAFYQKHVVDRLKSFTTKTADKDTLYLNKQLQRNKRGTFWQQVRVLAQRTFALLRRDVVTLLLLLIILPLIGIFLATISTDKLVNDKTGQETLIKSAMFIPAKSQRDLVTSLFDKWPTSVLPCVTDPDAVKDKDDGDPCPLYQTRGGGVSKDGKPKPEFRIHTHEVGNYAPAPRAQRLVFMMTLAVALLGIFAAASTIVTERTLFFRERLINVRISSYLASKLIVYGGLALISAVLLLILVWFGVLYPDQGLITWGPLEMFITLALTAFAGISIGIAVSALNKSTNAALALAFAVLIAQILFSGALFEMNGFAGQILSRLTVTRWAIESMGGTVHLAQQDALNTTILRTQLYRVDSGKPALPLTQQGLEWLPGPRSLDLDYPTEAAGLLFKWGGLLGFSIVFVGIAYLALRRQESF